MAASIALTNISFRKVSNIQFIKIFYIIFKIQCMNTLKLECFLTYCSELKSIEHINCKQKL